MYSIKHPFRTKKSLLLIIFLLSWGCEKQPIQPVTLDSTLKTHYQQIQGERTGGARVQLQQYMERNGESPQPLFLMGLSYHKEKKYTKAVEWFEKSTNSEGDTSQYPPTLHFLGWSYYYLGEIDEARKVFKKFLQLYPNEGDSLFALGLLAVESGNYEKAEGFYLKSIVAQEKDPKGIAKAKARLGDVRVFENKVNKARDLYLEALTLDPDLYEAWFRLSNTYRNEDMSLFREYLLKSKEAQKRFSQNIHNTSFPE